MTPPRVLMVIHTRWSADLGAPQAQMALAASFATRGIAVEKFSYEDAFPETAPRTRRTSQLRRVADILASNRSFAARVETFLKREAGRFDIIDANQSDIPRGKEGIRFHGLLVTRSVGLMSEYRAFEQWSQRRWPQATTLREVLHRCLVAPSRVRQTRDATHSFREADLINVSSRDDWRLLSADPELASKTVYFPLGISSTRREALLAAARPPDERQAAKTIAFVGTWNPRKGSKDWPSIVRAVREQEPGARFLFLGTSLPRERLLPSFDDLDTSAIEIDASFRSEELPSLLASATLGAFPGYLEGFGISVLEKLAAGLPTVAYDSPGPRDIMANFDPAMLVARGDSIAFASKLISLLRLSEERYRLMSRAAAAAAERFDWDDIAERTLATYSQRWSALGT